MVRKLFFALSSFIAVGGVIFSSFIIDINVGGWLLGAHVLFEGITIIISLGIVGYIISTYSEIRSPQLVLFGIVLGISGLLDILHTMSFPGMARTLLFPSVNLSLYFWIFSRIILTLGLIVTAFASTKPTKRRWWHPVLIIVLPILISFAVVVLIDFSYSQLPALAFIFGLTHIKIFAGKAVVGGLVLAGILFSARAYREKVHPPLFFLSFVVLAAAAEAHFVLYETILNVHVVWGHVLKVVAYVFIYMSIVPGVHRFLHHKKQDNATYILQ